MIEFLPPRDDAFGSGDPADFVGVDGSDDAAWGDDEPPRSRWLTALAVLGVTGLLAGGVIAAAPWSGEDAAPTPTTTALTTPSTTTPRATTTTDPADAPLPEWADDSIPGWVLPEGGRFLLTNANSFPNPEESYGISDPYDVWAAEGATRTDGSWLSISYLSQGVMYLPLRAGAVATDLGGARALVTVEPDGVLEAVVDPTPGTPFRMAARGIELERLSEIAAQISIDRDGTSYGDLVAADGRLDGMVQLASRATTPWYGSLGLPPSTWTSYYDPTAGEWIEITTAEPDEARLAVADLLLSQRVDEAALAPEDRSRLERLRGLGVDAEVRSGSFFGGWQFVSIVWPSIDGTIVSVMGSGSLSSVLDVAAQAVPAAPRQWSRYVRESARGIEVPGTEVTSPPVSVAPQAVDDLVPWGADVLEERLSIYGENSSFYGTFATPAGQAITTYRTFDEGFLLITATGPDVGLHVAVEQPAPAAPDPTDPPETTVSPDGAPGASEPLPLVWVPDHDVAAIVVRIDPNLPFTVRWFDAQGAPVPGPER